MALVEPVVVDVVDGQLAKADGSTVTSDCVELVCGPPVLWAIPVRGSGVDGESSTVDPLVAEESEEPDENVDDDDPEFDTEPDDVELDGDEPDELVESESGVASANPGVVATAVPMPNATANAPTRPMNFALSTVVPPATRSGLGSNCAQRRPRRQAPLAARYLI